MIGSGTNVTWVCCVDAGTSVLEAAAEEEEQDEDEDGDVEAKSVVRSGVVSEASF